jgi:DNA-binding MarR family transcriptional regulator
MAELRALAREIDRTDRDAADRFGVNQTDLRAVELLATAGSLAPTTLAAELGLTTGGVTTVIDRLERVGYARRRPDPNDRRRVIVEATEQLRAREAEIFGDLLRSTERLVVAYSDPELATIRDFFERFRAIVGTHGKAADTTGA